MDGLVHTVAVPRRLVAVAAMVGWLAVVVGACSADDGRALPPADPQGTTTTSSTPSIQPPTGELGPFTLRSTAFAEGAAMPAELTCTGASVSPDLSWTGTPADAAALAIVVRDRNAGGFVHWVVTDVDPFVQGIGEGGVPENAVEGRNDAGTVGWLGPCPPAGSGTHTYEVVLLALPGPVVVPPDATGAQAAALLEESASERAVLTGTVTAGSG
jgi:Raf kinase inhibitor-like YbhB/YbcL family protein